MRRNTFQAVRQQYGFAYGYCGTSETEAGSQLTVDHFHPRSQGGADSFDNLVYCCHACNEHKGDYWNPGGPERMLHPLNDDIASHVALVGDDTYTGLTDTGRFHIRRLQLNRPALVNYRSKRRDHEAERAERREILRLLGDVTDDIARIKQDINALRSGGE